VFAAKDVEKKGFAEVAHPNLNPPIIALSLERNAFEPDATDSAVTNTDGTILKSNTPEAMLEMSIPSHMILL
jgi:hypothetical protein